MSIPEESVQNERI